MTKSTISIIIPALNEETSIGLVVASVIDHVHNVYVIDNGSSDKTAAIAHAAGATVISEPQRGYGRACIAGIKAASDSDILVFMDADAADAPEDLPRLLKPILEGDTDFVIGSRLSGAGTHASIEPGALTLPQRFGNWLACRLMTFFWKTSYTDLGPFRAIRRSALTRLNMDAQTFGWTVQMQVRGAKAGLKAIEIPVSYRQRIGKSKISGTVRGVIMAGVYILSVIFIEAVRGMATISADQSKSVNLITNEG